MYIKLEKYVYALYCYKSKDKRGYGVIHMLRKPMNVKLRKEVLKRDEHRCALCDMENWEHQWKYKKSLHIHHIDEDHKNNHPDNLVSLCLGCHFRMHNKELGQLLMGEAEKDELGYIIYQAYTNKRPTGGSPGFDTITRYLKVSKHTVWSLYHRYRKKYVDNPS